MADTHIHHEEDHDPTVHHEGSDINVRAVLWFAAISVVLAIVIHVGLYYMLAGFRAYENGRQTTPVTDVEVSPDRQFPPEPRLQPFPQPAAPSALDETAHGRELQESRQVPGTFLNPWDSTPAADWSHYRAAYQEKLNRYGWVDQRNGIVHIPIDEAKDRLLRQGLPSRPALPDTTSSVATDTRPLPGAGVTPTPDESGTNGVERAAGAAVVPGDTSSDSSRPGSALPTPGPTTGGEQRLETPESTSGEPNR